MTPFVPNMATLIKCVNVTAFWLTSQEEVFQRHSALGKGERDGLSKVLLSTLGGLLVK